MRDIIVIGIDPGKRGTAVAVQPEPTPVVRQAIRLPTELGPDGRLLIDESLHGWVSQWSPQLLVIERQWAWAGERGNDGRRATWTAAALWGSLMTVLRRWKPITLTIAPRSWQKIMQSERKEGALQKAGEYFGASFAQHAFPEHDLRVSAAESALIALCGWRVHRLGLEGEKEDC